MDAARHSLRLLPAALTAFVLALAGCGREEAPDTAPPDTPAAAPPAEIVVEDAGFQTPESVQHDAAADVYLVSNINGNPADKDGNGFISRVSPDGEVLVLRWIDGEAEGVTLHAPKGMAIRGDTLFVADIDCLRMFQRGTGRPAGELCPEGATFLNGVAVAPDGSVLVTDSGLMPDFSPSGTDAVYRVAPDGSLTTLATGEALGHPNGIAVGPHGLVVVTFGTGEVLRVGDDGSVTPVASTPGGQLDGLLVLPDGDLLLSSWGDEAVYRLRADGTLLPVVEGVEAPADIGYDAARNRVLVPLFMQDRVVIRALDG